MKSIVLQKTANRELRYGWQDFPYSRKNPGDNPATKAQTKEHEMVAFCDISLCRVGRSVRAYDPGKLVVTKHTYDEGKQIEERQSRYLDITSEFRRSRKEARKNKKVHGTPNRRTIFGRNARHTLLEAGSVAQGWSGCPGNSVIVTLTLPGSTREAYATLASWSGYVVDRLGRWLRKAGDSIRWFFVWELQKRGALHLHLCISSKHSITSLYVGSKVIAAWQAVLQDVGSKSGVDLFLHKKRDRCTARQYWQNDMQHAAKSVAAYFVKYASKNTQSAKKGFDGKAVEHPYYPSRWWGCQRVLRREIEQERFSLRIEGVEENDVAKVLILVDRWATSHNPTKRYRYDFEIGYVNDGYRRPLGYGERHIAYFDDSDFTHVCNDLIQLSQYLLHYCNNAKVICNKINLLHTPVDVWSMQSKERLAVP